MSGHKLALRHIPGIARRFPADSLVGDDALGDLAHVHEEEGEGQDPAEVVSGEVQPGVVVDLHL